MRDKIGRWLPFGFWVFMTIGMVVTLIVCISLVVAKLVVGLAIYGIIVSAISLFAFGFMAWAEWEEAKYYDYIHETEQSAEQELF